MTDITILEQAQKICRNLLDINLPVTPEKINDAIKKVRQILPVISDEDEKILHDRLISATGTTQDAPRILDDHKTVPWILDKWAENPERRKFWRRYRDYLTDEKKFAPKVVARLDELTDSILDRLADPDAHDQFDKRGLVVGHVQSGKTSNYIGLINKAADAGYKLIVVLAGIHNSLRSQTQLRVDEGFLGYDTETSRNFTQSSSRIGVGEIDRYVAAHSLTSSAPNGDFRRSTAETVTFSLKGTDPVIIVIKKNNSVLKNLIEWLAAKEGEDYGDGERIIKDIPLLLIDDEADNASINISKSSVSAINGSIRAILELFEKSAYVGYTATPYANVFIPTADNKEAMHKGVRIPTRNQSYPVGEDLFPRNFIVNIPPPSNYIGPEKIFGIVSEDKMYEIEDENDDRFAPINLYEPVDDYQPKDYFDSKVITEHIRSENNHYIPDKHRMNDVRPSDLPPSLKTAVKFFILSCAARRARGQKNVHNSMLIHVTRFVDWQNHIALLVNDELLKYRKRIEFNQQEFISELKIIWEEKFIPRTNMVIERLKYEGNEDPDIKHLNWKEVEIQLLPAVTKIQLRAVHGSKLLGGLESENIQALDYYERKNGLSVIAVGGNKLSRGLTLEGLTVSYYLRSSKMYDTLMQMGRWFGYRPGYLDLCRLFTSRELISNYKHVAMATDEMRTEFDRMALLKKQPIHFGLKVRSHTGVLSITASNKFRYRKMMTFSFSGGLEETWEFDVSRKQIFQNNHELTQSLISKLGTPSGPLNKSPHLKSQPFVWSQKDNYMDVLNFLSSYQIGQQSFHTGLLREYIENQVKIDKLRNWTIAFVNNSKTPNIVDYYGELNVGLSFRKNDPSNNSQNYSLVKSHIIGSFHEYIDLTDDQLEKAFRETREDRKEEGKDPKETIHPNPLRIRSNRPESNGLLLIYPLDPNPEKSNAAFSDVPIIGIALSFPYIKKDKGVEYAINEVFQKKLYDYPEELDIEDLAEDEIDEHNIPSFDVRKLKEGAFLNLIESESELKFIPKLDDTELIGGMTPDYSHSDDPEAELEYRRNIMVPASSPFDSKIKSLPFYSKKEIQRFFLTKTPENKVLLPDSNFIFDGEYLVGMSDSKYVIFSYNKGEALFSDDSWIIRSSRLNTKYLVSLFNSTLFGAWARIKGKQKKETYYINRDVLTSFPIITPLEEDLWLFENIYELLVEAGKIQIKSNRGTMQSYYSNILDALILSLYFNESMNKEYQILHSELYNTIPRILPENLKRQELAIDTFEILYHKTNPVRKVLFYLDDIPKVSKIKSVFTQNN
ncbi:MAG: hypothetical protein ACJA1C_002352 [Crocinitomicaceae bacterium]|jgi:hypothetical protein